MIALQVDVTNTGPRDEVEIVQFYASHRAPLMTRPAQQLFAFARVTLKAGETKTVRVSASTAQLAYV